MRDRKERVTVTLDRALVEAANAAVAAGAADSISAWINVAVEEHVVKERRLAALSDLIGTYEAEYGVITAAELAAREREDRRSAHVIRGAKRPSSGKRRARAG
jgi:hypothetical protein